MGLNVPVLVGTREVDFGQGETKSDLSSFGVNLNAGFGYAVAPRWTVIGSLGVLGFNSATKKPDGGGPEAKTNDFDFLVNTLGNRFTIGFYYTFLQKSPAPILDQNAKGRSHDLPLFFQLLNS